MEDDGAPHGGETGLSFGDNVRIRHSAETEAAGIAGKVGQIYGHTTPSVTGVVVIGQQRLDYAINVYIEERDEAYWFAEELLEFVDHGAGTTMEVGDSVYVRRADGEWEQVSR